MSEIRSQFMILREKFIKDIVQKNKSLDIATNNYDRRVKRFIRQFVEESDYPNEELKRADYRKIKASLDQFIQSYMRTYELYDAPMNYMTNKLKSTIRYLDERSSVPADFAIEVEAITQPKPKSPPEIPFVVATNVSDLSSPPREFATAMERLSITGVPIARPVNPKPSASSPRSSTRAFIGGGAPPEAYEQQEEEEQ